jgi:hypothetical protein
MSPDLMKLGFGKHGECVADDVPPMIQSTYWYLRAPACIRLYPRKTLLCDAPACDCQGVDAPNQASPGASRETGYIRERKVWPNDPHRLAN